MEPEPVIFAGVGAGKISSGSGLLLCDQGVLWRQNCDNSYNFSQILTIFTQIERKNRYTFKKQNYFTLFFKSILFLFEFVEQFLLSGDGAGAAVAWVGAGDGSRLERRTQCSIIGGKPLNQQFVNC